VPPSPRPGSMRGCQTSSHFSCCRGSASLAASTLRHSSRPCWCLAPVHDCVLPVPGLSVRPLPCQLD
jgi:hypothetical protein